MVGQSRVATTRSLADAGHAVASVDTALRARPWRQGEHAVTVSHDYRAYRIELAASTPETNGHLHRLGAAYRFTSRRWALAVGPVVATSSNAGRHPKVLSHESVDWHAALRHRTALSASVEAFWGVCRDGRFGRVRVSPMAGVDWRASDNARITLAWPDSGLAWRFHRRWQLRADVNPGGGHWRVFDDDLVRRSAFAHRGWRVRLGVAFDVAPNHQLTLQAGREIRRSFRFRLASGEDFDTDVADAGLVAIHWRWR